MSIPPHPSRQPVSGRSDPMRSPHTSTASGSPASAMSTSAGRSADRPGAPASASAQAASAHAPTQDEVRRIAECAYFIAERRHFAGGDPLQDWLEAKKQVLRET